MARQLGIAKVMNIFLNCGQFHETISMKNSSLEKTVIILVLLAGGLLSFVQFIYNRSLWLDEAYLALNIINKSHLELLKPLDYIQVAPVLFLQIEKLFSELIPNTEYGLRLFPLLSFWFSIFFFYKIIKGIHQNSYTIIFSLSLFVFNASLIYYSSEVKQYMTDVLVLTSVYYFVLKKYKTEQHKYYYLCLIGSISIFLSNVAPIILFTAGFYLLFDIYRDKKNTLLHLIVLSIVWASIFFLYYFMFIHNHPSRNAQITNFAPYDDFMPINPLTIQFYQFLYRKGYMVVNSLFQFGPIGGISLSALILIGIGNLIRKRRTGIIILAIVPIILHLLLSGFKLYPFDKRLILYTCPFVILVCSFGFNYLVNILFADLKIERFRLLAIFIPLLISLDFYGNGFPIEKIEIKKSIKFIEQNMIKNDRVFVNYYSRIPYRYYKEIFFMKTDPDKTIIGNRNIICFTGDRYVYDTIKYANELNLLNGRVWFLFTQIGDEVDKIRFLKKYLQIFF